MSIFNFFKRAKKNPIQEKHDLENLPGMIEKEIKEINRNSEIFIKDLNAQLGDFLLNAKEKSSKLKSIDVESKRKDEPQRLKDIVTTSLKSYIFFLDRMIENLAAIGHSGPDEYIGQVRFCFNTFNKSSRMIYERATILIGEELAEIRDLTDNFAKEFNKKIAENKKHLDRAVLIKSLKENLDRLEETKKVQEQINHLIEETENKRAKIETEKQSSKSDHEAYRNSRDAQMFIESQEKIKKENKDLDEDISKLKQEINLRDLSKQFHDDSRKSETIKKYSRDFSNSLKDDSNYEIIMFLKQSDQNPGEDRIKKLRQRILERKNLQEDAEIKNFTDRLLILERELNQEEETIRKEKEKMLKFKEKQDQISKGIEEMARNIWDEFA